jgi:hypothetical protein
LVPSRGSKGACARVKTGTTREGLEQSATIIRRRRVKFDMGIPGPALWHKHRQSRERTKNNESRHKHGRRQKPLLLWVFMRLSPTLLETEPTAQIHAARKLPGRREWPLLANPGKAPLRRAAGDFDSGTSMLIRDALFAEARIDVWAAPRARLHPTQAAQFPCTLRPARCAQALDHAARSLTGSGPLPARGSPVGLARARRVYCTRWRPREACRGP